MSGQTISRLIVYSTVLFFFFKRKRVIGNWIFRRKFSPAYSFLRLHLTDTPPYSYESASFPDQPPGFSMSKRSLESAYLISSGLVCRLFYGFG